MDTGRTAHFRERLERRKAELVALISAGEKADVPISPDSSLGRLTRVDALQNQQMASALVQRNREELSRIDRALLKIESGDYGQCVRCEDDIADARLEAVPDALLCRACADQPGRRAPNV